MRKKKYEKYLSFLLEGEKSISKFFVINKKLTRAPARGLDFMILHFEKKFMKNIKVFYWERKNISKFFVINKKLTRAPARGLDFMILHFEKKIYEKY